jgi:hypothetical protein
LIARTSLLEFVARDATSAAENTRVIGKHRIGGIMEELETAKRLGDEELISRFAWCVREERKVTARLLAHMGEIEARGLHRDLGYESMFDYAVRAFHMSDAEAGLRIYVARFVRAHPGALEMLSRGEIHLTALRMLAPVVAEDNAELLKLACFKTKHEIQQLIAKHVPQPDVPDSIRRLPSRAASTITAEIEPSAMAATCPGRVEASLATLQVANASATGSQSADSRVDTRFDELVLPPPSAAAPAHESAVSSLIVAVMPAEQRMDTSAHNTRAVADASRASEQDSVVPLSEGRYKVQFTANQRVRDKLQEAQDLFRNQLPHGNINLIFERALDLLLAHRKKQLFAQTGKPRRSPHSTAPTSNSHSRYIPNEVRRQILARDEGRCRFVNPTGQRCCARGRLEFHHIEPFARGGKSTIENLVLLCRAHNALFAERDYGREYIRTQIEKYSATPTQPRVTPTDNCDHQEWSTCSHERQKVSQRTSRHVPEHVRRRQNESRIPCGDSAANGSGG